MPDSGNTAQGGQRISPELAAGITSALAAQPPPPPSGDSVAQKVPISPRLAAALSAFPIKSTPCNMCGVGDKEYDITGPQRDEIVADYMKVQKGTMSEGEFGEKWASREYPERSAGN
ncbi:hypothetical protein PWT90_01297 [Aphanocladium album]|nr:hypothetical protein PWT90_01297 [Aphanocladium album]